MASSGKRKTTMAKLNREARLRDKRYEKEVRKEMRKQSNDGAGSGPPIGEAYPWPDADPDREVDVVSRTERSA